MKVNFSWHRDMFSTHIYSHEEKCFGFNNELRTKTDRLSRIGLFALYSFKLFVNSQIKPIRKILFKTNLFSGESHAKLQQCLTLYHIHLAYCTPETNGQSITFG